MKRDIYIYTKNKGPISRTMNFCRGGVVVNLDFNKAREIVGVEVIDARKIRVDGKAI